MRRQRAIPSAELPAALASTPAPTPGALVTPKRMQAEAARKLLVADVNQLISEGATKTQAFELVALRALEMPAVIAALPRGCSAATLERWWRKDRQEGGTLADSYKGRVPQYYEWQLAAIRLYQKPNVSYAAVARKLMRDGYDDVTEARVRRVIKRQASIQAETSPARIGKSYRKANHSRHRIMDWSAVPPGGVYEGDGHCIKAYCEHPSGNGHFRPELTVWMDRRTRRIVGFWMSESESADTTKYSLAVAIQANNHVPAYLHVDPGPGFKNKQMTDALVGLCTLLGTEVITAYPGNAKGKGAVEGWFGRLSRDWTVFWDTYMDKRTDDVLARFETKLRRGEITLPTFEKFHASFVRYVDHYNSEPLPVLGGKSPNQVWDECFTDRMEPTLDLNQILRHRVVRTVRNSRVKVNKHLYGANFLGNEFETREVIVEIDNFDVNEVGIYTPEFRYVGQATLEQSTAAMPMAFGEEKRLQRLEAQIERLDRKRAMKERQALLTSQQTSPEAELLQQGHSITTPAPQAIEAPKLSPSAELLLKELRNKPAQARRRGASGTTAAEERSARWQRACELEASLAQGDEITEADAAWLGRYQQLPEYRTQQHIQNKKARSVGSTPGLDSGAVRATPSHVRIQNDQRGDHDE